MSRRASKRDQRSETQILEENSKHDYKISPSPSKKTLKSSKIRGRSPQTMPPLVRRSSRSGPGSSTGQPWSSTPTTTPLTATSTVDPGTPGGSRSIEDNHPIAAIRHRNMVPSTWTTASGKFDPQQNCLGFDAKSNVGINGAMIFGSSNSVVTGADDSECSPSSVTDVPDNFVHDGSSHSPPRRVHILDGEIEDPVRRNRFYKSLKKKGIRKHYTFDENWETSSSNSVVSDLSISAASYILDLAQQKESRAKDREDEALEEALDLYGTWLAEGKTDDRNIFMMILHEVKKEFKFKYAADDRRQDKLLDAALEEEIQRREQIRKFQVEEARKLPRQSSGLSDGNSASDKGDRSNRTITVHSSSVSRINEIIEKNATQKYIDRNWDNEDQSKHARDKNNYDDDFTGEWREPYSSSDIADAEESKPDSNRSLKKKKKIRSIFSWGGKSSKAAAQATAPHKKDTDTEQENENESDDVDPILAPTYEEDSKSMFSRLRIKLSEKNAQQRKEEEKWWKKIDHVETKEEKWWKKINEAQKESTLFDRSQSIDSSRRQELDSTNRTYKSRRDQLDSTNRTTTDSTADPNELAAPVTPAQSISTLSAHANAAIPTLKEGKKEKRDRRKSSSHSDHSDLSTPSIKKDKSSRRKTVVQTDEGDASTVKKDKSDKKKIKDKEGKLEKKKKKKPTEWTIEGDSEISPLDTYMNAYIDGLKSPKSKDSKDKKKKKKSKSDENEKVEFVKSQSFKVSRNT